MATATITGALRTFGGANFNHLDPVIIFRPDAAGLGTNGNIFSGPDIRVIPDLATGNFTQALEVTETMLSADAHYQILIEWREPSVSNDPGGIAMHDTGWKLYVPTGGGDVGDLAQKPPNKGMVIVSPVKPRAHFGNGTLWLQMDPTEPDNPDNPANTGDLYRLQ